MINRNRLWFVAALFFVAVGLLVWRLVTIQIVQRQDWKARAEAVHQRRIRVPPERGNIYDRNGKVLAFNRKTYSIAVDSYDMTKPELLIDILVNELNKPREEVKSLIYRQSYFTWIDRTVSYETGERIKKRVENANIDGLIVVDSTERVYPRDDLCGSIIGFTGIDGGGLAGVEYSQNEILGGDPEIQRLIYGANRYPYRRVTLVEGRAGYDVYLTLDLKIQYILKQELQEGVKKFKAKRGWGVVLDPETGAVLGMTQNEGYNPNDYQNYKPDERKILPAANTFEPGSILKVFSGLAALDYGVVDPDTTVNGDSPVVLYNHPINNAQYRDYGMVPFTDVIKHSINTGMVRVAQELGERRLYNFLNKVGFGRETGVELAEEESGQLNHYSQWSGLSIGTIPIGQGISVTALQLAAKMASVANGGNLVKPTLVKKVETPEGNTVDSLDRQETIGGQIASRNSIAEMKDMLRLVVKDGTGQNAAIPGYGVSGKTGTAQKAEGGRYVPGKYFSSFAGFFPRKDPEYLILIVLDEVGTTPVWGGATAGKIFKEVGTRIIKSVEKKNWS